MLFKLDSAEDLVCRGFTREQIQDKIGVDVGYHAAAYKTQLKGVDRFQYKLEFVKTNKTQADYESVLSDYASMAKYKEELLNDLGVSAGSSGKLINLEDVFEFLGLSDEFKKAQLENQASNRTQGCIAKYGTDNVFKLQEFQDTAKQTRVEKYGGEYTLSKDSSLSEGARNTFAEHMKDDTFRENLNNRKIQTCLDKYGVEHPMQSEDVRHKVEATWIEHYGVNHPMKNPEIQKRVSESNRKLYAEKGPELRAKYEATCFRKYGVKRFTESKDWRKHQSEIMKAAWAEFKTGTNPDNRFAKMQKTMVDRYGTKQYRQSDVFKQFVSDFMREHRDEIREKIINTNMQKYGVHNVHMLDEYRRMQSEKMLKQVSPYMNECQRRAQIKKENGTLNTSSHELSVYDYLIEIFPDLKTEYICDEYKHRVDFYIPSRELFVELNILWTHGCKWYDADTDLDKFHELQRKSIKSDYYKNASINWTERDVQKRADAKAAGLNYVVFWMDDLADFYLWFAMGCPDGHDYDYEYSWLIDNLKARDFGFSNAKFDKKTTAKAISTYVRNINRFNIYKREIAMWNENRPHGKYSQPLQVFMYINRYKYLNKLPDELTDADILRGFGISGVIRPYTVFNTSLYEKVLNKYKSDTVLDPCAGWGERLIYCGLTGRKYVGYDINSELQAQHNYMISSNGFENHKVFHGRDVAMCDLQSADICITCPPYHDVEIYTDSGIENKSYDEFLYWWRTVALKCYDETDASTFAFQINQKYLNDMKAKVEYAGWKFVEQFDMDTQSSHFTRSKGGKNKKKEFESMLVFVR